MKILVAIANYGTKNLKYLEVVLAEYQRMSFDIEIVVLSNEPKKFGPNVEVLVGLPDKNPWSLPFAHKTLFAERRNDYDLFIYTEDDVLITERNIRAFLRATEALPEDRIAGFIRSETVPGGKRYYSTMHCHYHWEPESVMRKAGMTFARYTNDHSGCVLMTRAQLERALASKGFLRPFRRGRYGFPETAATDAYTQCGLTKMICISQLQDFCLPHLPNVYVGKIGVEQEIANREIAKLLTLDGGRETTGPLFRTETALESVGWDKEYYEAAREDVVAMVPRGTRTVLSVGCGWGATEAKIVERGAKVTAIPVDCVVAVTAAGRGIEVLAPSLEEAGRQLTGRRFDCIVFNDSLNRFKDPAMVLKELGKCLAEAGTIVVGAPNFNHVSVWKARLKGRLKLGGGPAGAFTRLGLHLTSRRMIRRWLAQSGLIASGWQEQVPARFGRLDRLSFGRLRGMLLENLVVAARRRPGAATNGGAGSGSIGAPSGRGDATTLRSAASEGAQAAISGGQSEWTEAGAGKQAIR